MLISIRAPARGATVLSKRRNSAENNFNPRSREGSDWKALRSTRCLDIFQSALPRGERLIKLADKLTPKLFQSALPRGERPVSGRIFHKSTNFNPRSREGSDNERQRYYLCIFRFQSALPRGERPSFPDTVVTADSISIRAPARGATPGAPVFVLRYKFQSALPRGERRTSSPNRSPAGYFNPRSREGSDNNFHQKVLFSLSKNCLIHLFFITNFLN